MYELPTSVTVGNRQYKIRNNGDFRLVLDCFAALQDEKLDKEYRVLTSAIIFYEEFTSLQDISISKDIEGLVKGMFNFMNCGKDDSMISQSTPSLINWEKDSQIICAAVNTVANQEIRAIPYLHWWTFLGYYMSIGESVLSTVVSIRNKIVKGKSLEKWEKEFRRDNPQYFVREQSEEEKNFEEQLRNMWNR